MQGELVHFVLSSTSQQWSINKKTLADLQSAFIQFQSAIAPTGRVFPGGIQMAEVEGDIGQEWHWLVLVPITFSSQAASNYYDSQLPILQKVATELTSGDDRGNSGLSGQIQTLY
jgi:hypothetical protein